MAMASVTDLNTGANLGIIATAYKCIYLCCHRQNLSDYKKHGYSTIRNLA